MNFIGINSIVKIYNLLNVIQRKKVFYLIILIFFSSAFELLGLGLIIPSISALVDPNYLNQFAKHSLIKYFFNDPSQGNIIYAGIFIIILIYLLKNLFLSYSIFWQNKFAADFQADISSKLFSKYLNKDFSFHLNNNSSGLIRNINELVPNVYSSLLAIMTLFMEIVIMLSIMILLIKIETLGTIVIMVFGIIIGFLFSKVARSIILEWGHKKVFHQGKSIQSVMEGLGGIKMIKILGREKEFQNKLSNHLKKYINFERLNSTFQQFPRVWLEFVAILSLCILLFSIFYQGKNYDSILPIIALFTGAAFKLIPSTSKILSSIQTLGFNQSAVDIVYNDLRNSNENLIKNDQNVSEEIFFNIGKIQINNISYKYTQENLPIIKNLSLEIKNGASVGIIGETGSGKSTLVDILLGLLKPKSGQILINGIDIHQTRYQLRQWQKHIGYVPQDIYLMDDTIANNIIFGLNKKLIDKKALNYSLKYAQLDNFINSLPNGIETKVGERGVRLSGGQLQRIGIARALYHNPSILIFDEATSSLDYDTEDAIVDCIDQLEGKTKIIIAHRLSSVKNCDYLIKIDKGSIEKIEKLE